MMDDGSPYVLLDVRTPEEYAESHIDGAVLIPDTEIADRADAELIHKDARIYVYCRTGVRSASATKILVDMGYTNVYDIGGIVDWPYGTVDN
jgi:rhodanese-related sulfurtransferase